MNGLTLSRAYWEGCVRPMVEERFPHLLPRLAAGLVGEGSDCFGFDDEQSRDHDWGPGVCLWLSPRDAGEHNALQQAYDALLRDFAGYPARVVTPQSSRRVGVFTIAEFYSRYVGLPSPPVTIAQWRCIPESFLATAVNGEVFWDPLGEFTAFRAALLDFYPEDYRLKKLAARAAVMAQAGQYNFPRCVARQEWVAAHCALNEFLRAGISMIYLLNRRYAPFYKWMHRGLAALPRLGRQTAPLFELLCLPPSPDAAHGTATSQTIEQLCGLVLEELVTQRLVLPGDSFLQEHCSELLEKITDPTLRALHPLEE